MTGEILLKEVLDLTVQPTERETSKKKKFGERIYPKQPNSFRLHVRSMSVLYCKHADHKKHKSYLIKYMQIHMDTQIYINDTITCSHSQRSTHTFSNEPYLTLFHADISLALSLSISSGSPVASLLGSGVCAGRRPKLPCCSRGCCLRPSVSSSCITPPTYCAALGEMEFMALSYQSWTLLLLIATQNWGKEKEDKRKGLG